MGYDEGLAARIMEQLEGLPSLTEKKMFGGIAFLLSGNMICGILGEDLIVRVGKKQYENAMQKPHTKVFDLTGKPMRGWVTVKPDGFSEDEDLEAWLRQGLDYARSLPAK
jgi:TfoX/Sxy family transcriptional regulator of competence genes